MLDRSSLANGRFLDIFRDVPGLTLWDEERLEASMREAIAQRPPGHAVWLFAYGSLIWNPLFHFVESCPGTLDGWRRSFCMRLIAGRGCVQRPGRMMSLVPGGWTQGLALRMDESNLEEELRIVWRREMLSGSYVPLWAPVQLQDGREVQAILFTANPDCPLHETDDRLETVLPLIAAAQGPLGSNREYVLKLDEALRQHGLQDPFIQELAAGLRERTCPSEVG